MSTKNRLFEIWFALRCGPANTEFQAVLAHFGTPYDVFNADDAELEGAPCSPKLRRALADKSLQESADIDAFCQKNGVGILFWQDEYYPAALRPLRDPPVLLYFRGTLPDLSRRLAVSVVGTRRMSEYGKHIAYKIGYELAAAGAVVVSGMALGNDSVAAAGAIAAGGHTVAVLGSGIDVIYPREHDKLYAAIMEHGAVLTEYPPSTPPIGGHFPVRNRIISGLSQATVVMEADYGSGALITAKTAILQGRDIYAFPGNVGELNASGTNQLISDGAAMALSARDVLENYSFLYRDTLSLDRLSRAEGRSELRESAEQLLLRLGVCTRTHPGSRTATPPPQSSASGRIKTAPTPKKRRSDGTPAAQKPIPMTADVAPAPSVHVPAPPAGDASARILRSLSDIQRKIFEAIPLDHAVPADYLAREGFAMSDIMAAVTVLEIRGLVTTLPGGLVGRK